MRISINLVFYFFLVSPHCSRSASQEDGFFATSLNHTTDQSIIGGTPTEQGSRPYLVAISGCGASIISPRAVMTAANCLFHPETGEWDPPKDVVLNRYDVNDPGGEITISLANTDQVGGDAVYHPRYNPNTHDFDVAILFLPTSMSNITTITMNQDPNIPTQGDPLEVAGWGATTNDDQSFSDVLLSVDLNYLTNTACTTPPFQYENNRITNNMMCAFAPEKDSCGGDSGGPLMLGRNEGGPSDSFVQVGIVSWRDRNAGCASSEFPGVYTRVSSVADWVQRTVCARVGEYCPFVSGKSQKTAKKTGGLF